MLETLPVDVPLSDRTATGIAMGVGHLISTGRLSAGDRLPTIRAVAAQLDVSPTTVTEAWRILQRHGAIVTEGRRGSFVRGDRQVAPGRYWQVPVDPGTFAIDLSAGTPDPALLPPLGPILGRLQANPPVTSYLDAPVVPELEAHLRAAWPFPPEAMTVVDGAQDALDRLVGAMVGLGDAVVVTDPEFPPLLDRLDLAGARVLAVELDEEGPVVDQLAAALDREPVAVFLQPRAQNPTGGAISESRAAELAELVTGRSLTVVEDDHSGSVAGAPLVSLGPHCPEQVVHLRSFSKSHGPDLRLAAVGGAAGPIDAVTRRRRLGPSWSSRLLQQLLLTMLTDEATVAVVAAANAEYGQRRRLLVDALTDRGIEIGPGSGFNLWIPVHDEQAALVNLAANGIGAAPGSPFRAGSPTAPTPGGARLRVSVGPLDRDHDRVAELLAAAAAAGR